jgi:hypothetical protein
MPQQTPVAAAVPCPYCLELVRFSYDHLYLRGGADGYTHFDPRREHNPTRLQDQMRGAFQLCPNTTTLGKHYIPAQYLTAGAPLTIATVGNSTAGKTHLLAAMLGEVERGGLDQFGLGVRSINGVDHDRYVRTQITPLHNGWVLPHTLAAGKAAEFVDGLLIDGPGWTRPVAFFDLAGEDFMRSDAATRFLAGVDALIFVVDPVTALPSARLDPIRTKLGMTNSTVGDRTFRAVLDRVERRTGRLVDVPAVLAISKCDLIRYEPPVDRWLGEPVRAPLDPYLVEEESRDVFAYLTANGGDAWLRPFLDCRRCALHFTSATGGQEREGRFPQGARGRRALQPLLSLFAMCGMLDADARLVGL